MRTNADTAEDATRARRFGAQGIGLCRTEHMFLGDRRGLVENLIVAESEEEQEAALSELLPLQRQDFNEIFEAMDGLPVTIRMIDPPLHEFLPDITELSVSMAVADVRGHRKKRQRKLLSAVQRLHESNPMLGLRGVRLGIVIPGLFVMQARAILEAAAARVKAGGKAEPEIMIPLVASVRELDLVKDKILKVAAEVQEAEGTDISFMIGTMIELPRAALTADHIAGSAEFFSFGTNDLTQMTWGFSRDDVEASFFSTYLEQGVFPVSPFESLDIEGVGALVKKAVELGRSAAPRPASWASAASTAATHAPCTSSTAPGSTTCRAHRSACRSRAWRRAARPSPTRWLRRRASAVSKPVALEQRAGELLTSLENPRVGVADRGEQAQQVLARLIAVLVRRPADELDQPVEGVIDVAAEQVEVGDEGLGVDVVGPGGRVGTRGVEIHVPGSAAGPWPSPGRQRPPCRQGWRRPASGTPPRHRRCPRPRARPGQVGSAGRSGARRPRPPRPRQRRRGAGGDRRCPAR